MGICFSVIRGRCVSSPTPNAHLAPTADQKAPAGLGQLVNEPLPLLFPVHACWTEGTCELDNRHVLSMPPLHSHILDEHHKKTPPPHQSESSDEVGLYVLYTLHNLFIDVFEPLI